MRAAPAVDAALGSGRVERMLITGLHAGSGAALALWAAARAEADLGFLFAGLPWLAAGAGALVLGAVGFALALQALPCAPARLCWDSTAWHGLRVALQAHAGDPNKSGDSAADPSAGQPGARP